VTITLDRPQSEAALFDAPRFDLPRPTRQRVAITSGHLLRSGLSAPTPSLRRRLAMLAPIALLATGTAGAVAAVPHLDGLADQLDGTRPAAAPQGPAATTLENQAAQAAPKHRAAEPARTAPTTVPKAEVTVPKHRAPLPAENAPSSVAPAVAAPAAAAPAPAVHHEPAQPQAEAAPAPKHAAEPKAEEPAEPAAPKHKADGADPAPPAETAPPAEDTGLVGGTLATVDDTVGGVTGTVNGLLGVG